MAIVINSYIFKDSMMPMTDRYIKYKFSKLVLFISLFYLSSHALADIKNWERFKTSFISAEGRVIDTGNGHISHSEGQGVGMLLAVAHNDRPTFELIWKWTFENLALRDDGLFVWQWLPDQDNHIEDLGSASDGDILIAWAMARAAEKWKVTTYTEIAKGSVKAIHTQLVAEVGSDVLLLPGPVWPRRDNHTILNLSYWIYPAFQEFSKIDASPIWEKLIQSGISLISRAQFGAWELPADWMAIRNDGSLIQTDDFSFVFGYEAVRIPLFYLWGGFDQKDVLRIYQAFWSATAKVNRLVTVLGLATDDIIQQENVLAYRAVNELINCAISKKPTPFLSTEFADYDDYYSVALYLMTQLVAEERLPYCLTEDRSVIAVDNCNDNNKLQCPLLDPIPEKIEKGNIIVHIKDFIQLPAMHVQRPLARINVLTFANDNSGRLFAVDIDGRIYIIHNGQILPDPFLDIAKIRKNSFINNQPELGLKAITFHPDFALPGTPGYQYLYTVHTESPNSKSISINTKIFPSPSHNVYHYDVVSEWSIDPQNPNRVLPDSQREILRIAQPFKNHNTGYLSFNPHIKQGDPNYGLLYIAIGDGGWPENLNKGTYRFVQDLSKPFGTILRINPQPGKKEGGYSIPKNNPFINKDRNVLPEIWAYGLRNSQQFSWDKITGYMFIADIGQDNIEEVNIGIAGANYGWNHREGSFALDYSNYENVFPLPPNDETWNFTYPLLQYDHDEGWAIFGGFVYRGKLLPELVGYYVFNDLVNGRIFYTKANDLGTGKEISIKELRLYYNGAEKNFLEILNNDFLAGVRLGVDKEGELYVFSKRDGMIRRLLPMPGNKMN